MPGFRTIRVHVVPLLVVALGAAALAQPSVSGATGPLAPSPADVVAEARGGLAWFPYEVGRGRVQSNGTFELRFWDAAGLTDDVTTPITSLFDAVRCDGLTVSDPGARVVVVRELRLIPRDATCEYCKTLGILYAATRERDSLKATGDHEVQWIHVDRDVSVAGRCTYGWGEERYALELGAGWNTVVIETTAVRPTDGFCDCREVSLTVAPFPAEAVSWFFVPTR